MPSATSQPHASDPHHDPPSSYTLPHHGTPLPIHYGALVTSVLGPISFLIPGRRRGLGHVQNMGIIIGTLWALNQLTFDYTGQSVIQRSNSRYKHAAQAVLNDDTENRLARNRKLMEMERARRALAQRRGVAGPEAVKIREEEQMGLLKRIWMGGESEGWRERRAEAERKALASGKGYGDLLMDYIRDAGLWTKGEEAAGTEREKDIRGGGVGGEQGKKP